MPAYHGLWLEDLQGIEDLGHYAIKPDEHQAINVGQSDPFGRHTPQDVELVPKHEVFGLQGSGRPEQSDHEIPNQPAKIAHRDDYRPIRRRSSAVLSLRQGQLANFMGFVKLAAIAIWLK